MACEVMLDVYQVMHRRVSQLIELPVEQLDRIGLACEAQKIAQTTGADASARASRSTS